MLANPGFRNHDARHFLLLGLWMVDKSLSHPHLCGMKWVTVGSASEKHVKIFCRLLQVAKTYTGLNCLDNNGIMVAVAKGLINDYLHNESYDKPEKWEVHLFWWLAITILPQWVRQLLRH